MSEHLLLLLWKNEEDKKQINVALLTDQSKVFDTADHLILKQMLNSISESAQAV